MKLPWWLPFGQVAEIDARALHAQLQTAAAPQIIDVRTTLEWSHSRIGNALSVPVTELKTRLPSLMLDKSRPVGPAVTRPVNCTRACRPGGKPSFPWSATKNPPINHLNRK